MENRKKRNTKVNKDNYDYDKNQKSAGNKSLIVRVAVIVVFIVILVFLCTKAYGIGYGLFQNDAIDEPGTGKDVVVNIPKSASDAEVAELLEYNGLIKDVDMFKLRCKIYDAKFHEGSYTLNTSMTTEEMLDELRYAAEKEDSDKEQETTKAAEDAAKGGDAQ